MERCSLFPRHLTGALLVGGIALADLYLKGVIASSFFIGESVEVIPGFFTITFIRNPGVAFGLLSSWDSPLRLPFLLVFSAVAVGFIIYLYFGPLGTRKLPAVGLPLIAGGALANFYERLTAGAVVDYLDFYISTYHWPAFNLADAAVSVGVALLFIDTFLGHSERKQS